MSFSSLSLNVFAYSTDDDVEQQQRPRAPFPADLLFQLAFATRLDVPAGEAADADSEAAAALVHEVAVRGRHRTDQRRQSKKKRRQPSPDGTVVDKAVVPAEEVADADSEAVAKKVHGGDLCGGHHTD